MTHPDDLPTQERPELAISWGFIVGMLRYGSSPETIRAAITRNDRVTPGWRDTIPEPVEPA